MKILNFDIPQLYLFEMILFLLDDEVRSPESFYSSINKDVLFWLVFTTVENPRGLISKVYIGNISTIGQARASIKCKGT